MNNLTTTDSELHHELVTAEGQAKAQIEGVKRTMSGLEKAATRYTSEIETEADKQQRELAEQKAYLEKQQQEMIGELSQENQKQIQQTAAKVTEAPGAQRRVLKVCYLVARELLAQSFWVPNARTTDEHSSKRRKQPIAKRSEDLNTPFGTRG